MKKFGLFVFVILIGALLAGGVFLLTWDIPAPSTNVEKVIPNDRLTK
ncbi:hypothetical protein [Kiloniella litopenaei]|nr:hypothetical protein [Kiloniella litopenaei]